MDPLVIEHNDIQVQFSTSHTDENLLELLVADRNEAPGQREIINFTAEDVSNIINWLTDWYNGQ